MAGGTGKVLYGPWSNCIGEPMQLEDFHNQAQQYLNDLNVARNLLTYVHKLFKGSRDIWPDQCERTLTLIQSVHEPVQNICQLLDPSSRLPEAVAPLRYSLAIAFQYLDDQLDDLINLINHFRVTCRQTSVEVINQREEINHQFEPLMGSYDDATHEFDIFLDRVYFQVRKRAHYG